MEVRSEILNPGAVDVQITITMRLDQWKEVAALLQDKHPQWELKRVISDLVYKVERGLSGRERVE